MTQVDVAVEGQVAPTLAAVVHRHCLAALEVLALTDVELSVLLCDDAVMTPLNAQWRGKDQPTDVLSFALDEGPEMVLPPGFPRPLGDLVISVQTATRQAGEIGHDLDVELGVLVVHGLLHLLGFDHETGPDDAAVMRAEESRVLAAMGGGVGLVARVQ